ncbi:MAG: aminomethyl-transferring glycine dehydrogenase subunit GcvPB [candidate division NC10 bacterium]|nr:aminomethyl-transferring glycine dehydrogenase subunit GcvPB [candidate division NC10 bacterium]
MSGTEKTVGTRGLILNEPLVFEQGSPGRTAYSLPPSDVPERKAEALIPKRLLRDGIPGLPELSEVDVMRHFTRISQWNYCVDLGFYPLGSCTMKYNPRINEDMARIPGFAKAHPYQPEEVSQGALQLMWELEQYLADVSGMDRVTLQPSAGAHGELTGVMMIRSYHASRGNPRSKILIPDSAHGTNPASSALCGYKVVPVKEGPRGVVEPKAVAEVMDDEVAAIMVTNPNTLGLFEDRIIEVAKIVHAKGGQVYCDGANLNSVMGVSRPGDWGVDVIQINLHKTFSQPHGGGGPGAGPVALKKHLAPFMPVPTVEKQGNRFLLDYKRPKSIGKVRAFYASFGVMVRSYTYIRSMGPAGLRRAAEVAVLNANYILSQLKGVYHLPYDRHCMHECVFTDALQARHDIHTLDIAKRLIDYGFHPPTIYFPLIVKGALMIEPTETESKETIDQFVAAMKRIAQEAQENPEILRLAPHNPRVTRMNETKAAREPKLRWRPVS